MTRKLLTFLALLIACSSHSMAQETLQTIYSKAIAAYNDGDYKTFMERMQQVNELRPNHPTVLYNLSIAYAKNDQTDNAFQALERVIWMNTEYPFETDTSFNNINGRAEFKRLLSLKGDLKRPFRSSREFMKIGKEHIVHAEGMAYDPKSEEFFLGDVYGRKIIRVAANGKVSEFASGSELLSIMGMDVDQERGLLWVCATEMDEMLRLGEADTVKRHARLMSFDIKSGQLKQTIIADSPKALFGDLVVAPNGNVYATSSAADHAAIYQFDMKSQELEVIHESPELISLQGLVLDGSGKYLFFSDYRAGLFRLDLTTGNSTKLRNYTKQSLKGIDGLYLHSNRLIAIHNGLRPFQVTAYQLTEDHIAIQSFEYLDRSLPEMGEPTLGVLVAGQLYYIANSPWPLYDQERKLDLEKVESTIILGLNLSGN
jgi:sugar lactone lactonase YvrE